MRGTLLDTGRGEEGGRERKLGGGVGVEGLSHSARGIRSV